MLNLLNRFQHYLTREQKHPLSNSSIKNYLSDLNHFLSWLKNSIQEPEIKPSHITPAVIKAYRQSLPQTATSNRRLSSLRRFGEFLISVNLLDQNPCENLDNLDYLPSLKQIINQYEAYLKTQNLSESTIKNYLSDLNQYLNFINKSSQSTI